MKKKNIDKISSPISDSPDYKHIEESLDFGAVQNDYSLKNKSKKRLLIGFSASILCLSVAIVGVLVPVISYNNEKNNQEILQPIPDDLNSFFKASTSSMFGSPDIGFSPTISSLYFSQNEPNYNNSSYYQLVKNSNEWNINGEMKYHCFYVTKEIYSTIEEWSPLLPDELFNNMPKRGITKFFYCNWCGYLHGGLDGQESNMMEMIIDSSVKKVSLQIGDYYLLDIVRYFKYERYPHFSLIDCVSYQTKKTKALIDQSEHKDKLRFRYLSLFDMEKQDSYYSNRKYEFLNSMLDMSFEIIQENGLEMLFEKSEWRYYYHLDENPAYYDELDKCIVRIEEIVEEKDCLLYKGIYYDYIKISNLIGF